jgi:uncharacterized protein (DUF2267 family)
MTTHAGAGHDFDAVQRAGRSAQEWIDTVAEEMGTEDRNIAYRALRSWLHAVRDRIGVESTAHFAAQLPVLLRGVYFDGWRPSEVPIKYTADQFLLTIAQDARIGLPEARHVAAAVTSGLSRRCSPGQVEHLLAQFPAHLRAVLTASPETVQDGS